MSYFLEAPKPRDPVQVRLNEWFSISPRIVDRYGDTFTLLDAGINPEHDDEDYVGIEADSVPLLIEGVGTGRVDIFKSKFCVIEGLDPPFYTPAGPIQVRAIALDEQDRRVEIIQYVDQDHPEKDYFMRFPIGYTIPEEIMENTLPLAFGFVITTLTPKGLDAPLGFHQRYGALEFTGSPDFLSEEYREKMAAWDCAVFDKHYKPRGIIECYGWRPDPKSEYGNIYLPQRPNPFDRLQLMISG